MKGQFYGSKKEREREREREGKKKSCKALLSGFISAPDKRGFNISLRILEL
jgi:hypothetical protein